MGFHYLKFCNNIFSTQLESQEEKTLSSLAHSTTPQHLLTKHPRTPSYVTARVLHVMLWLWHPPTTSVWSIEATPAVHLPVTWTHAT